MAHLMYDYASFLASPKKSDPYYFGLGFIKCRLSDKHSMNFYDLELGATLPPEEVHDHRYDFVSTIVAGHLNTWVYERVPGDDHEVWSVSCTEGETDELMEKCSLRNTLYFMLGLSAYFLDKDAFHRVAPGPLGCITSVERSGVVKPRARVIRRVGAPKVCPYAQKIDTKECYERIEKLYATLCPSD
jgi:hypothetical protein